MPCAPFALSRKRLHERRNVRSTLVERRQDDRDDVEPVEEILAELPGRHHRLEIAIRGGDDADVHRDRLRPADPLDLLLLQAPEDLSLQRKRQVADLVEEEGGAGGRLEEADLPGVGAGEGAPLVPEQLALEEVLGDGGAVDGVERPRGARGAGVNGARHQLLARARLAPDQDGGVRRGDLLDEAEDLAHRRALAHDRLEAVFLQPSLEAERLLGEAEGLEGPLDAEEKLVGDDRLRHVVEGTELVRLPRALDRAVGRDEDHLRRERPLLQRPDDVDPGEAGHLQIRQDDLGPGVGGLRQRLAPVCGDRHAVPLVRQEGVKRLALVLFVVDDEDGGVGHGPMLTQRRGALSRGRQR